MMSARCIRLCEEDDCLNLFPSHQDPGTLDHDLSHASLDGIPSNDIREHRLFLHEEGAGLGISLLKLEEIVRGPHAQHQRHIRRVHRRQKKLTGIESGGVVRICLRGDVPWLKLHGSAAVMVCGLILR